MGEEVINKEEAKVEAEPKKKESPEPEAAPAEEDKKKEDEQPSPPPPVILGVEVHCTGCAKRIRRSLLRCKGVQAVHVDTAANQVTIKGVAVDTEALCQRLRDKTKRDATLISPLPPPPPAPPADGEPAPAPPAAEEPVRTVELLVNMHCDACAEQLQRKMLKMKGVKGTETDLAAGKLMVTGTVEGEKIVEYIRRRTGKLATVVPPPEEPPKEEEAAPPAEVDKPADDGKKEGEEKKQAAEGDQAGGEEKKEAASAGDEKPGKQEGGDGAIAVDGFPPEEMMKRMVYWPYGPGAHYSYKLQPADAEEATMARRMHAMPPPPHHHHHPYGAMMHHQWMPPPPPAPMYYGGSSYMMERPPQMFSDENPNACVIS